MFLLQELECILQNKIYSEAYLETIWTSKMKLLAEELYLIYSTGLRLHLSHLMLRKENLPFFTF